VRRGPRIDRVAAERVNLLLKCMSDGSIKFCCRLLWPALFQNISARRAGGKSWWCCEPQDSRGVTSQVLQKKPEMTRWRIGSEIEPSSYTTTTKTRSPFPEQCPSLSSSAHQDMSREESTYMYSREIFGMQGLMEKVTNGTSQLNTSRPRDLFLCHFSETVD